MANNPHRGDHVFTLPSAPETKLTLRYDLNALAALQAERGGRPLNEILAELQPKTLVMQAAMLRQVLWFGLARHHPEIELLQVGQMIEDFEDLRVSVGAVLEALTSALPEVKSGEVAEAGASDPQPPAAPETTGAS